MATKKPNAADRIMNRIADHSGTTSIGLLAADLRLSPDTVRKHVKALKAAGRVEDGLDNSLAITIAEARERAIDARVKSRR